MSELVGHGEGQRQPSVLADAAAVERLAHTRHMGQAQRPTGLVHGYTQVLPAGAEGSRPQADLALHQAQLSLERASEEGGCPLPPGQPTSTAATPGAGPSGTWTPVGAWGAAQQDFGSCPQEGAKALLGPSRGRPRLTHL